MTPLRAISKLFQTEELHRRAYNGAFGAFGLEVDGQAVEWDVKYYDKLQNTVINSYQIFCFIRSTLTLFASN